MLYDTEKSSPVRSYPPQEFVGSHWPTTLVQIRKRENTVITALSELRLHVIWLVSPFSHRPLYTVSVSVLPSHLMPNERAAHASSHSYPVVSITCTTSPCISLPLQPTSSVSKIHDQRCLFWPWTLQYKLQVWMQN